jgi:acyl dehydratase
MKFAEFVPGTVIEAGSYRLSREELLRFARDWDPQPFHVDPAAAEASKWGGLIASGWQTCAIAMRIAVDNILAGSESIGSPGIDEIRWKAPVRPDDELTLKLHVLSSRQSSSGEIGIVRWRWELTNQTGILVLTLVASSFFSMA